MSTICKFIDYTPLTGKAGRLSFIRARTATHTRYVYTWYWQGVALLLNAERKSVLKLDSLKQGLISL